MKPRLKLTPGMRTRISSWAQVCEQREDYAKALQTLEAGLEQTDDQRLRAYIWQFKVSLLEKPGAIEGTALNGTAEEVVYDPSLDDPYCEVVPEGYTRSVLLALDDVTPAVFRFVRSEFTLHATACCRMGRSRTPRIKWSWDWTIAAARS